jgi:hypothetical protein
MSVQRQRFTQNNQNSGRYAEIVLLTDRAEDIFAKATKYLSSGSQDV